MGAYHRPRDLSAALTVLAAGPVTLAAGCTDLFPATGNRALPGDVLDLTAIRELRGITRTDQGWRIGATTTWSDILRAELPPAFDGLKLAAREVGSVQIQNAGTLAGNLCNASPAADGVPCLLTLDAEVELAHANGRRHLALGDFLTGPRQTALRVGEVMTAVHIPARAGSGVSGFVKLGARRHLVISIAMAAVRLEVEAGRISRAYVAVGACSAVAQRLTALEQALAGAPLTADIGALATPALVGDALSPIDDIRADAPYRRGAATTLVARLLERMAAP
ncbi:FAD binding domain-containing protein [Oceanibium sediminis]|uniref:FAD binding domain-containing protein n=1 Tax=Oceanibium sediminis TaxID=2026339 RepID=UPI000DD3509C|nr:FAD binding domain-containing protein [Oceanibium sediminis]